MPIEKEVLKRLLLYLDHLTKGLKRPGLTKEILKEDEDVRLAMERRLQTAIECCIDISFHIISGEALGVVEHNKDALLLLGTKGIINKELAGRLADATDMSNVLVHGYDHIDLNEFYKAITEDLNNLKDFSSQISDFLEKNPQV